MIENEQSTSPEAFFWPTEPGWYTVHPKTPDGLPTAMRLCEDGSWWCHLDGESYRTEQLKEWGNRGVRVGKKPRPNPYPD